jgi:hypothetical protein
MTTAKLLYASLFSTFLLAGCDGSQTKISQADQRELTQLREEKKTWASEKAQMQESLTLKEKEKNEAVAELDQLKEEFQAFQDKSASDSGAKPEVKDQKMSVDPLLKK